MFGNVMDLAFYHVKDTHNIKGLNWRLMLGSVRVSELLSLVGCTVCSCGIFITGRCSRAYYHDPSVLVP